MQSFSSSDVAVVAKQRAHGLCPLPSLKKFMSQHRHGLGGLQPPSTNTSITACRDTPDMYTGFFYSHILYYGNGNLGKLLLLSILIVVGCRGCAFFPWYLSSSPMRHPVSHHAGGQCFQRLVCNYGTARINKICH